MRRRAPEAKPASADARRLTAPLRSVQLDDLLPAVRRIADQGLPGRIDYEVHQLQRHLANEHRAVFRDLDHVAGAVAALDRQTDRPVDRGNP